MNMIDDFWRYRSEEEREKITVMTENLEKLKKELKEIKLKLSDSSGSNYKDALKKYMELNKIIESTNTELEHILSTVSYTISG